MRIDRILWYRRLVRHLVILALLVGCSRSKPAVIDLRPLTITFDGHPIAKLFADGHTESAGPNAPGTTLLPGPTLHGDGVIQFKGGVTARVAANGDISVTNPGKPAEPFGRIANNRLEFGINAIRVDDATIHYETTPTNVIGTIEGTVDDRRRQTALVLTAAFLIDISIAQ